MEESQEIVKEFLVESHENLDQLDRDLVALEQDPRSRDLLSSIFRTIHTIKGTCGFLGFGKLESIAHVGENLLCKLRDGDLLLNPEITSGLLAQVDAIRQMLESIEQIGNEGDTDYSALREHLTHLQQPGATAKESSAPASDHQAGVQSAKPLGEILRDEHLVTQRDLNLALHAQAEGDGRKLGEILVERGEIKPEQVSDALKSQHDSRLADASIRVDVSLLDKLMNQVGELVLARNQILQFTGTLKDSTFLSTSQRLNLITTELQEGVMKTRMHPIGNIWSKFPRVVRDLALQCGKEVRIEMEGEGTELDKTIVEAIKDPLTHLVRNSVDHGIENPDERAKNGKPREGCLLLRAFHEGGQVNIEITDDGAGLNLDRIRQKGVEKGLVSQDQALRLSDRDAAMLIFAPGFSTAAKVTNVSGRGVVMDVVKPNVEKIGGTVDIQSQPGRGSTVKLKIPLTLAIIPALVVTCGGDRYAIPQVSLLELVRLEGAEALKGIERLHGAPVYRLRGQLLPIVHLRRELGLEETVNTTEDAGSSEVVNIVVLRADDRQFGLIVDSINDTEEIVVKPLSKQLKEFLSMQVPPSWVTDRSHSSWTCSVQAQRAKVVPEVRDRSISKHGSNSQEHTGDRQTLLILALGDRRVALPISMVSRLEELPASQVEQADHQEVVQYRGQILPLVRLCNVLGIMSQHDPERPLQVVVYSSNGRSVGLVVDRIADIVDANIEVKRQSQNEDLVASAVIQDRVTDLLNLPTIIRRYDPTFFEDSQFA
ncbi:MAG: chemotaxis protein CheW [Pirellulales bacterium]